MKGGPKKQKLGKRAWKKQLANNRRVKTSPQLEAATYDSDAKHATSTRAPALRAAPTVTKLLGAGHGLKSGGSGLSFVADQGVADGYLSSLGIKPGARVLLVEGLVMKGNEVKQRAACPAAVTDVLRLTARDGPAVVLGCFDSVTGGEEQPQLLLPLTIFLPYCEATATYLGWTLQALTDFKLHAAKLHWDVANCINPQARGEAGGLPEISLYGFMLRMRTASCGRRHDDAQRRVNVFFRGTGSLSVL